MGRLLFVVAVVLGVVSAPALTAGAAQTTTYHGVFSGPVVYKGCTTTPPTTIASGTWGVALHGQTDATVSVSIFTDGAHHLSFGGTFAQITPEKNQTFAVEIPTQAGNLVVSLKGQAFSYRIAPYDAFGVSRKSVTYNGVLSG